MTPDGPAPDVGPLLARGGRVLVFEQTDEVLSRRLGFRTNQPRLRNVSWSAPRIRCSQASTTSCCATGAAQSTLLPDHYTLPENETGIPKVDWLGFNNTRAWKWGNWGQVASALIEKPQTGDFCPLVDGGFDLQYPPLLLMRTPQGGEMHFCQLDVTGRTSPDPVARRLVAYMLAWASGGDCPNCRGHHAQHGPENGTVPLAPSEAEPSEAKSAGYVGDDETLDLLRALGANLRPVSEPQAPPGTVVIGPEDPETLKRLMPRLAQHAAKIVLLFQSEDALRAVSPAIDVRQAAITHTLLAPDDRRQPILAGVGPAELHFRGRTEIAGVVPRDGWSTATGTLAAMPLGRAEAFFCQVDPRRFDYTAANKIYLKLTHNRTCTLLSRVLANCGVPMDSRLVEYWSTPVASAEGKDPRWLHSYYLDQPTADDDPYRYDRW